MFKSSHFNLSYIIFYRCHTKVLSYIKISFLITSHNSVYLENILISATLIHCSIFFINYSTLQIIQRSCSYHILNFYRTYFSASLRFFIIRRFIAILTYKLNFVMSANEYHTTYQLNEYYKPN